MVNHPGNRVLSALVGMAALLTACGGGSGNTAASTTAVREPVTSTTEVTEDLARLAEDFAGEYEVPAQEAECFVAGVARRTDSADMEWVTGDYGPDLTDEQSRAVREAGDECLSGGPFAALIVDELGALVEGGISDEELDTFTECLTGEFDGRVGQLLVEVGEAEESLTDAPITSGAMGECGDPLVGPIFGVVLGAETPEEQACITDALRGEVGFADLLDAAEDPEQQQRLGMKLAPALMTCGMGMTDG